MPRKSRSPRAVRNAIEPGAQRKAVIYARVSSKEQEEEGFSIPAQLKLLREYARKMGLVVAEEYVDVETAKRTGRTHYSEMLRYLSKAAPAGKCRVILVEKTDRLYRNLKDYVTLEELDIEIHLVKEGAVLSKDSRSTDRFMHGIKVLMARNYIDNLSEEVRKGLLEKAEQGIWPALAPLGYRNVMGSNGKRVIEVDPETGPHLKRLFERYAAGNVSIGDLARMAHEDGLVYKKSGAKISKTTLLHVLKNRIYFGEIEWHGRVYTGRHVPLVSRELFDKVQAMLNGNSMCGGPEPGGALLEYTFRGMVRCGSCSRLLSPYRVKTYTYYVCPKCPKVRPREAELEEGFENVIAILNLTEDVVQEMVRGLKASVAEEQNFHREALTGLQAQYDRLQKRLEGVYQDKLDGEVDLETYRRMSSAWRTEQSEVLRKMEAHQEADRKYLDEGVTLLQLLQNIETTYKMANVAERQRILKILVSNSQWIDGKLEVQLRKPFCYMVKPADEPDDRGGGNGDGEGGCTIIPVLSSSKWHASCRMPNRPQPGVETAAYKLQSRPSPTS